MIPFISHRSHFGSSFYDKMRIVVVSFSGRIVYEAVSKDFNISCDEFYNKVILLRRVGDVQGHSFFLRRHYCLVYGTKFIPRQDDVYLCDYINTSHQDDIVLHEVIWE